MKILISGASGLIGSALVDRFQRSGHEITRLVRGSSSPQRPAVRWDPTAECLDPSGLEGFDAVVHLAGENVASGRWSEAKKRRIRESRVHGTRVLSEALAAVSQPPKVFASASAVGYYGHRGGERLDEQCPPGSGFLAEVCRDWEHTTQLAAAMGIRVVLLRIGLVLAAHGGALPKMLPALRRGLGGRLGNGRQYVSWITLDDVVGAIDHLLADDSLSGPFNLTAPRPVQNRYFTQILARALNRRAILPAPAFLLRAVLGEMADELLLAGARAIPKGLRDSGYEFRDPELDAALQRILADATAGKPSPPTKDPS